MAQRMQNTSRHQFANCSYFLLRVVLISFWVYRVFYCNSCGVGYIIRLHFRRFKLAVSIRAPALTRNKGSVEGKQESVLEMVAKVRRTGGSHLIETGWTPDIEAQGSADQQLGTKISGAYSESPVKRAFPKFLRPARSPG